MNLVVARDYARAVESVERVDDRTDLCFVRVNSTMYDAAAGIPLPSSYR